MNKNNIAIMAIATSCVGVLLSGCGPREDTVVVQEPQTKVVEKTTVKAVPEDKPKTIIVKPAEQPAPKVENKTNVKVNVKPGPTATPSKLPDPAPVPEPKTKGESTPPSTTASNSKPESKSAATSKKTAAPKPKPASRAATKGLVVRAEVVETSKMPDPKTVPYKDALIFTKYKVLEVENGEYQEKEILVAEWGMKDKKLQPAARRRAGDVQTLSLEPLAKRPELESVMRSDDTNEFELEPYFAK